MQRKYFPQMVLAEPEEFESVWNEYYDRFQQLNVEQYEETMTKRVKEKIEAVTGGQ